MRHLPATLVLVSLGTLSFSCASSPPRFAAARELLDADRAFDADTQKRRIEGWLAAFDVHGSQSGDDFRPVTGAEAIRAAMGPFFADPLNELTWVPERAIVSEGGRMGSTSGRFQWIRRRADGSVETQREGRYFDIWRRTDAGEWKLLFDAGDFDKE